MNVKPVMLCGAIDGWLSAEDHESDCPECHRVSAPKEGELYRPAHEAREVLIDLVTSAEVFLRVTDGNGGLLAARRVSLREWYRLKKIHFLEASHG